MEKTFELIENEFFNLQLKWQYFVELYATTDERIQVLDKSARGFFGVMYDVLYDDIILSISKLALDPASSCGNENLSFQNLLNLISEEKLKMELEEIIQQIKENSSAIKNYRNKTISHFDKETNIDSQKLLNRIAKKEIEKVLSDMREFLYKVYKVLNPDSHKIYDEVISPRGAEALLYILGKGLRYNDLRRELPIRDFRDSQYYKDISKKRGDS